MKLKNIKDLANNEFSNVRVAVDYHDYDIEKDTRLLIPFSYYQHYGMMNKSGEVVVEPKYDESLTLVVKNQTLSELAYTIRMASIGLQKNLVHTCEPSGVCSMAMENLSLNLSTSRSVYQMTVGY